MKLVDVIQTGAEIGQELLPNNPHVWAGGVFEIQDEVTIGIEVVIVEAGAVV